MTAPNIGIYGETGRLPLSVEAVINAMKYWLRLETTRKTKLLISDAYKETQKMENVNDTFYHNIQYFVDKFNININFSHKYICNKVRQILNEQFTQYWKEKLFEDPAIHGNKLRSYRTYKNKFQQEEYLRLSSKKHRGAFTRLRLSAHNLEK